MASKPVLIVYSEQDPAGVNIKQCLVEDFQFQPAKREFDGLPVYSKENMILVGVHSAIIEAENLESFEPEYALFASKHQSESGEPTFTVHSPGLTHEYAAHHIPQPLLAWSNPQKMKGALLHLHENRGKYSLYDYKVSFEATHHGPASLPFPVTFIEIGSKEKNWRDHAAGQLVAETIVKTASTQLFDPSAVGFGGGHYSPKQTEMTLTGGIAVGHTIAKYAMEEFDERLFRAALEKTHGGCRKAVVDWKGLRGEVRRALEDCASTMNVEVLRA